MYLNMLHMLAITLTACSGELHIVTVYHTLVTRNREAGTEV